MASVCQVALGTELGQWALAYAVGFEGLLISPFLTPASGKIHIAITMNTAVTITNVENSGRRGD